jgi:hypothetical protein
MLVPAVVWYSAAPNVGPGIGRREQAVDLAGDADAISACP